MASTKPSGKKSLQVSTTVWEENVRRENRTNKTWEQKFGELVAKPRAASTSDADSTTLVTISPVKHRRSSEDIGRSIEIKSVETSPHTLSRRPRDYDRPWLQNADLVNRFPSVVQRSQPVVINSSLSLGNTKSVSPSRSPSSSSCSSQSTTNLSNSFSYVNSPFASIGTGISASYTGKTSSSNQPASCISSSSTTTIDAPGPYRRKKSDFNPMSQW